MRRKIDIKILTTSVFAVWPVILAVSNGLLENAFFMLLLPVVFVLLNIILNKFIDKIEKDRNSTSLFLYRCRWAISVVSIISMCIIICRNARIESAIYYIIISLIGVYMCSCGVRIIEVKGENNYFKNVHYNDVSNKNTYSIVGYTWIALGFIFTALVYLKTSWFAIGMVVCIAMFIAPFLIFKFMFKKAKKE